MNHSEQKRFDELYRKHLRTLKLQGVSAKTIDAYSRAVRRIADWADCCANQLSNEQLAEYFSELFESHSGSTVNLDRCGADIAIRACCSPMPEARWRWSARPRHPESGA